MRTRSYPARLPHYPTVRAHHRTWAPSRAMVSRTHTHTLQMRNTMVVKGWSVGTGFAAERRLSEAPVAGGSGC